MKKIVFRRAWWMTILFAFTCLGFTLIGIWILNDPETSNLMAYLAIAFFGGGGIFYLFFMSWKPIVIITKEGITVPYGWGEPFVEWSNVKRIEQIVQTNGTIKQKYIGIFVFNPDGVKGANKLSKKITGKVTGWGEVPSILINNNFTGVKLKDIETELQKFYSQYKSK